VGVVLEITSKQKNGGDPAFFDFNEVVDKPRRARASIGG
jgi:hypothetical protein